MSNNNFTKEKPNEQELILANLKLKLQPFQILKTQTFNKKLREQQLITNLLNDYFNLADKTHLFITLSQVPQLLHQPSLLPFTVLALAARYTTNSMGYKIQLLEEYFITKAKLQTAYQLSLILDRNSGLSSRIDTFKAFMLLSLLEMIRYCDTSSMLLAEYAFRLSHTIGIQNILTYNPDVIACFKVLIINMKYFALLFNNVLLMREVFKTLQLMETYHNLIDDKKRQEIETHMNNLHEICLCPKPLMNILSFAYEEACKELKLILTDNNNNNANEVKTQYFKLQQQVYTWFHTIQPIPIIEWYPFFLAWKQGNLTSEQLIQYDTITIYELSILLLTWPTIGFCESTIELTEEKKYLLLQIADKNYDKIQTFINLMIQDKEEKEKNIRSPFSITLPLIIIKIYLNHIKLLDKESIYFKSIITKVDLLQSWIQPKLGWEDAEFGLNNIHKIREFYLL
ncbi:hypothetical protein K502DRAFT_332332 [Neoconidiobolus thromboides FSU 785]|nr:hypothetical protein K502DRAFT_332332 [Neoconidiobolus thromboides FSU 785]